LIVFIVSSTRPRRFSRRVQPETCSSVQNGTGIPVVKYKIKILFSRFCDANCRRSAPSERRRGSPIMSEDDASENIHSALGYRRPGSYEELRAVLSSGSMRLPRQLRQVAVHLSQNPSDIALGTVVEIAQSAGVQPSALVRFAQSLGYPGFSDLQEIFKDYVKINWPETREREAAHAASGATSDPDFRIIAGLVKASMSSLTHMPEKIDLSTFAHLASMMAEAETIYLIGNKRAFPVTIYMALALSQLGVKNSLVDNVGSIAYEQIGFASPRDVVFAISFSPYNSITPALAAAARQKGAVVLGITDSALSPLAPLSRAWLEINEADFGGFRSLAATMAVGMSLVLAIAQRRQKKQFAGKKRRRQPRGATELS
jgi:DNA-binding MurR/RpiR family transcriptional regulator